PPPPPPPPPRRCTSSTSGDRRPAGAWHPPCSGPSRPFRRTGSRLRIPNRGAEEEESDAAVDAPPGGACPGAGDGGRHGVGRRGRRQDPEGRPGPEDVRPRGWHPA